MSQNYKRNDISCLKWTTMDIEQLMIAYNEIGGNWIAIAKQYFPNRCANQLKCKYNYLQRRNRKSGLEKDSQFRQETSTSVNNNSQSDPVVDFNCQEYQSAYSFYFNE
ncbi:Myb-like_DNA-binding domain-containing protein [Hexamita inflata]|uniref:Myb-like DNA-binding domain-containing protein n=1 Tax=Hexamita inflata TaxID=28002 RepID=A0AA86TTE3_9EUKA|nr:Myb-like DNA-binding domain-containing protein [Hexamita inflata]